MKDRESKLTGTAEVLQGLFENSNSPLRGPFLRWKLWKKWPEFVGASIAQVSEPVGFREGKLIIWVKNSSWMQQMIFIKDQLRDTLNTKLGGQEIVEIQLTMTRNLVPVDQQEKQELQKIIGRISSELTPKSYSKITPNTVSKVTTKPSVKAMSKPSSKISTSPSPKGSFKK